MANLIHQNFLPVTIHLKQTPAHFKRFDVLWTPAVLFLDSSGVERFRMEGYLPRDEFSAQLKLGLGRIAFMHKQWTEAEKWYNEVVANDADTASADEATYWASVCHYKRTNDHKVLGRMSQVLEQNFPDSIWTAKASIWLPAPPDTKTA